MSQYPETPRLRDLVPDAVADAVVDAVRSHVADLAFVAGCTDVVLPGGSLRMETAQLVRWAQDGGGIDARTAAGCMQTVCDALYTRAADRGAYVVDVLDEEHEADDEVSVVLLAASCRLALASPATDVGVRELAALGGVAVSRLRQLATSGELGRSARARIDAADARRWLAARGVDA